MPRREDLPLYNFVLDCNGAYQQRRTTKVDCHRIAQKLSGYQYGNGAILRNDGVYIAGIKNNTRATVDHSAGSEFITNLYVVAILKLLAVWESGVY